jgi:hypothetical protein
MYTRLNGKGNTTMDLLLTITLRRLVLATLVLCSLFAPATTEVAHADPGYAYYWSLTFDYENNFNGVLHVDVGYAENGGVQNPALHGQDFSVTCQRVGNVSLAGGTATFNGGYLTCNLDVKQALEATFAKCAAGFPGCTMTIEDVEKYRSFRMLSQITSVAAGSAPIFYHEDATYAISLNGTTAQVAADLAPLGTVQSSAVATFLPVSQSYGSNYLCAPLGGCTMGFAIGGSNEGLPQANDSVEFSTPSSTIYIGYNPATGITIPAGTQITHLFIDPPNLGNH